ncbi:MAG: hypothetical protein AB2535_04235, partial [Candidatus Thiodiazotropha endolucinida]
MGVTSVTSALFLAGKKLAAESQLIVSVSTPLKFNSAVAIESLFTISLSGRGFIDNGFDSILKAYLPVEFHGGTIRVRILQTVLGPVNTTPMRPKIKKKAPIKAHPKDTS